MEVGRLVEPLPKITDESIVKVLTIKGQPRGFITRIYRYDGDPYSYYHWVRLKNGALIKDLTENEIEWEK